MALHLHQFLETQWIHSQWDELLPRFLIWQCGNGVRIETKFVVASSALTSNETDSSSRWQWDWLWQLQLCYLASATAANATDSMHCSWCVNVPMRPPNECDHSKCICKFLPHDNQTIHTRFKCGKCTNRTHLQRSTGDTVPFREFSPLDLVSKNVSYEDRITKAKRDSVRRPTANRKEKKNDEYLNQTSSHIWISMANK